MYNASERKDIRKAEKASAILERQRLEFVTAAMSTLQGRAWFHDFLVSCHLFTDPFTGDALLEAYSKGERNIGLKVYNDVVTSCPDYFVQMMREASIKDITNDGRNNIYADTSSDRSAFDEYSGGEDGDGGDQESV